ncbi:MAG: Rieske 2Fe-2S domain-containing protein [Candidatus Methanoperedens sp.]|nr:Rieske 2Fe-2S domain-containing protein [Candidatus Methanoperedens sp.]
MFFEAARLEEIATGGMKAVEAGGKEIVLCNYDGKIFALNRRCGHTNAPLDMGTLEGYILTCPMHNVQFDITTGEALSIPVPLDPGNEKLPERTLKHFQYIAMLMTHIRVCDIRSYPVKIDGGAIKVDVEEDSCCV